MQLEKILYLSGEDIVNLGGLNMRAALEDVEEVMKLVYQKDCILPGKTSNNYN